MKFRTEIEVPCNPVYEISHDSKILMLGTCFTDNISQQLRILKYTVSSAVERLCERIEEFDTITVTLGTSFVFSMEGQVAGNCHKLPPSTFIRRKRSVDECYSAITQIKSMLHGKTVIFTISPIRHVADTLHGNQVSKATLLTAQYSAMEDVADIMYFPSYEIVVDDLRDYRFYGSDLGYPSETAIQYI